MDLWINDLRLAFRSLSARPGFTSIALLTLTLGIGLNSLIFSLVDAVMISPLPFRDPEKLVMVWETFERNGLERRNVGYPTLLDWQKENHVFEEISSLLSATFTLTGEGDPQRVQGQIVDPQFFDLLGVGSALGRSFTPADNESFQQSPRAILGHELWVRQFGADPEILGRQIRFNGVGTEVVGVLPPGFAGLDGQRQLWLPMLPGARVAQLPESLLSSRRDRGLRAVARLRDSATLDLAQQNLDAITAGLRAQYPDSYVDRGALVVNLESELLGSSQSPAILLLGAVGLVLLIACANVANLLMARTAGRRGEISLRIALGATKIRLVRQLLTESLLLGLAGGALGVLMAWWGTEFLSRHMPFQWPEYVTIQINLSVLVFTFGLSLVTSILFGLGPALTGYEKGLRASLGGRGEVGLRHRRSDPRGMLVVSEVALSIVVLAGAGLLLRSFFAQQSIDPGFEPRGLLTMELELPRSEYERERGLQFVDQLLQRIRALPGVGAAGISTDTPLNGGYSARPIGSEDALAKDPEAQTRIYWHSVTPDYFRSLGADLLAGRDFQGSDGPSTPGVVVVSSLMARRTWPGENPLGKRLTSDLKDWLTVVGGVQNIRHRSLVEDDVNFPDDPDVYFPMTQMPRRSLSLAIRSDAEPAKLLTPVRLAVAEIDPNLPLFHQSTMIEIVRDQLITARATSQLIVLFAALALFLASLGIYGVLSNLVTERREEIGIRMALGVRPGEVRRIVMRRGLIMAGAGTLLGIGVALGLTRLLGSLLYQTSPTDPLTLLTVSLLFLGVAGLATLIPAQRAVRISPMRVLRT